MPILHSSRVVLNYKAAVETHIEQTDVWTPVGEGESSLETHTLPHLKQIQVSIRCVMHGVRPRAL